MVRASASQRGVEECFCVLKAFTQLQSTSLPPFRLPSPLQKSLGGAVGVQMAALPGFAWGSALPRDLLCTQELGLLQDGVAPRLLAVALGLSCAVC